MSQPNPLEPNFQVACQWWSDLPDIWTPVGWKDHLFRFNVLWSGTILARPDLNRRTEKWRGQGAQFAFAPSLSGKWDAGSTAFTRRDDGMTRQGWNDCPAPVLWTEFAQDGLLLRQEVFGHIPGGGDIASGIEPLFAWVRLSVHWACKALPLEDGHGFVIKINAPHFASRMSIRDHSFITSQSLYGRKLRPEPAAYSARRGWRLLEPGNKSRSPNAIYRVWGLVRMGIAPGQNCQLTYTPPHPKKADQFMCDAFVYVNFPAREGAHVDLLLPMLPTERATFDRELALGYDGALREANRYWARGRPTAARVDVPEPPLNDLVGENIKLAEVIAEKNPADGNYSMLNGSLAYAALWTTPGSMLYWTMDLLGCHKWVEKELQIFKKHQGTVVAPGDSFRLHPGYLSTPKTLTSIDWLADHGAALFAICQHALLSGDRAFLRDWVGAIEQACDFIRYARRIKGHGGAAGIMPPAVATDRMTRIQGIWNDGWVYKGLTSAVRLLRRIGHPRARELATEARDYRKCFLAALRARTRKMPRWTDQRGRRHPFVPTSIAGDTRAETRHAFYLDTGPMFLVFSGLMDARDQLMKSSLAWFREGPQTRMYRYDGNCWQVPSLHHEMSSCEPIYSFNLFHSHQAGDREKFLEGLYSLLAGGISRKTFISCETRGGQTGNLFTASLALPLMRLAVIDDWIKEGELHLLRLAPLAWLSARQETAFENMPTEFGKASLRFRLGRDGESLAVSLKGNFRHAPSRVVLHVPPAEGLREVTFNGRPVRWDRKKRLAVVEV